jgi:group I intron endonuclease
MGVRRFSALFEHPQTSNWEEYGANCWQVERLGFNKIAKPPTVGINLKGPKVVSSHEHALHISPFNSTAKNGIIDELPRYGVASHAERMIALSSWQQERQGKNERQFKNMEYHSLPSVPGIYVITNTISSSRYVGSSKNLRTRAMSHRKALNCSRHPNKHLQNAWNKYGEAVFMFTALEEIIFEAEDNHKENRKLLLSREQHWIDEIKPEYNIAPPAISNLGIKRSPEAVEKIASKHRGMKRSGETRANISKALKGRKGRPLSPEHKAKLRKGNAEWNSSSEKGEQVRARQKGDLFWIEHCARMSEISRNVPVSDETRSKLSATWKGRKRSEEDRKKKSEAAKNPSQETIRKRNEGRKRTLEAKRANAQASLPSPVSGIAESLENQYSQLLLWGNVSP